MEFVSLPDRRFPLSALAVPAALRAPPLLRAHALVLDSIAAAFLGPWLALRDLEVPMVAMLHQPPGGIDHGPLRSRLQSWLDRMAYRRAQLLLAASDALADELRAHGFPAETIRVVPPGRDGVPQSPTAQLDLRSGRRAAFLCVANWMPRKGIHHLLAAFERLPEETATLHLAGDGNADPAYTARIRTFLARPGLARRVVVHGPLPSERLSELYAAADVFVLPSLKEPYGTVYGEAMSAGLPVVGWRAGNLPYLAADGREGLLVPPGDIEGLSLALRRLAQDERHRRDLGTAARRRALTRPTWAESADMFFTAIREVAHPA